MVAVTLCRRAVLSVDSLFTVQFCGQSAEAFSLVDHHAELCGGSVIAVILPGTYVT